MKEEIKIDMRENLNLSHNDPDNPFAFTPEQLAALQDPKDIDLLHTFGGLKGIEKGLHADIHHGLDPSATIQSNVTLNDVSSASDELSTTTINTNTITETHESFAKRTAVFGPNLLPPVKGKNILQLMWIAFKDKTIILLAVAAAVSLAVGIYEDVSTPEYDSNGNKIPGVKWVEGVAIIVAILIVVLVGSINDFQKERQFRKLNAKKEDRFVKATRKDKIIQISVHDIQVGDVLYLEPGDIAPTDGVFIDGHNLRCDESAATGESDAVKKLSFESCWNEKNSVVTTDKHTDFLTVIPKDNNYSENGSSTCSSSSIRSSMIKEKQPLVQHRKSHPDPFIISGSKVLEGTCTYLVTGVGIHSYYGRTMMALRTENESTPLQEKLNHLASTIAKLGSAAGILMLVVLLIRYFVNWRYGIPSGATIIVQQIMSILIVVVTIVVVAVPEGLPLAVTLALAYATQRMLKDNNLVRVLAACETMGNATTVCSDKTGTLTQNKMTVVAGTLGSSFRFAQDPPADRTDLNDIRSISERVPKPIIELLSQGIAINSTAFESTGDDGSEVQFVGNKTESALLQFTKNMGSEHFQDLRTRWPIEQVYPFSSERKVMATVVRMPDPAKEGRFFYRVHVKGASEILVENCNQILTFSAAKYKSGSREQTRALTSEDRIRVDKIIQSYATRSLRTIGVAYRDFESWPPTHSSSSRVENDDDEVPYEDVIQGQNLVLLGIVGIEDPLRPGVKEAVKACQDAGVFVRMVTGDNVVTAKSIAKQCGIYTQGGIVMEGPVFRSLPQSDMDAILPRLQVLARSSPQDKQILVGRLKELGDIVAVTGDGTNDGPALKMANVGFSMGIAGTEVAKEASSIILMDDNFSSIVKAIMWGRCVNDSVKKFLEFQITVNITAVILTFVSAVASTDQKSVLTAVQLLWVNLIMDTFAALALATDPPTEELLQRGPESRSSPLITFKMWKMIIGQAIFQIVVTMVLLYSNILHYSAEDPALQTIVFNTFVFCQIFNEINCRRVDSKLNIFHNILANKFFVFIFFLCIILQFIIVFFGGTAFQVTRIDGVGWAISIVVGLLSIPIGVIIRLIPDEALGFVFVFNPAARQRYLGGHQDEVVPSIYMAGNERIAWNNSAVLPVSAYSPNNNQQQPPTVHVTNYNDDEYVPAYTPKDNSNNKRLSDGIILPGAMASAPFAGYSVPKYGEHQDNVLTMTGQQQEEAENFEDFNQDTVLSPGSLESVVVAQPSGNNNTIP